ncbi:flagellar basal body P-ring protein FlgI [Marinagarivorans cellulosilyticus]|uniref:Flagellar P-ring protein n=1 Tax=Marinagarivorans cellulosilyticus TaxID=2721545 RepID=A0AAN1WKL2_9GAMM|nr:flagellar basal body P-ring protein FlgI [Marinagarivorans cellulosilyticus]BCD99299.1 flagellar P-ring protein precursor FlgI [Marinagarivorans cellulosilyticus]
MWQRGLLFLAIFIHAFGFVPLVYADRIKDLASIEGVRANQLIGYGLVVGLDGSGDKTNQAPFTTQSFNAMLKQFGITIPPGTRFQLKNVAAVAVHAELPAFSKPGQTIDITVSSIGDAKSLRGGSLLMTPLKGIDGKIYAIAQGNLVVGGFGAEGRDGSKVTVNIPSVGRIPNGALVERSAPNTFAEKETIVFNLHTPDFTTAKRLAKSINNLVGPDTAKPLDAVSISVQAPRDTGHRVDYLSLLENIEIVPAEAAAKVIINSRTGTIVVGQNVRVFPVAITHGSLTVTVDESLAVSQPNAFADGETAVVPETDIDIEEELLPMFKFAPGPTLDDVVRAVNEVGAAPGDVMAILEALKQAGALRAELIVI